MAKYKINYNREINPNEHNDLLKLMKLAVKETGLSGKFEVSCNLVNSPEIEKLNFEYREENSSTDVLSFPQMTTFHGVTDMGDIYINTDILISQSKDIGSDKETEFKFLFMHGLLHIVGFDHKTDEEFNIMKSKEKEYFLKIGIRKV